jgi:hypothetical protein
MFDGRAKSEHDALLRVQAWELATAPRIISEILHCSNAVACGQNFLSGLPGVIWSTEDFRR